MDVLGCHLNIAGVFAKIYTPSQLLIMEEIIFLGSAEPCCTIIEQLQILGNYTVEFLFWRVSVFQISNKFVAPVHEGLNKLQKHKDLIKHAELEKR